MQITRSASRDEYGVTQNLKVTTPTQLIIVDERVGGAIKVRLQKLDKKTPERSIEAKDRVELKKKFARVHRQILAYEKMIGDVDLTEQVGDPEALAATDDATNNSGLAKTVSLASMR